jgi:type II secretory pathway component PulL
VKTCLIDWTESVLHIYFLEKKRGQITISDTTSVPLDGELNQSILSSAITSSPENIILSLPVNSLSLRDISFPFNDKTKINDTIAYELDGLLLGNTDDYSIDHIVTETTENDSSVLAVCIKKTRLSEIITTFSSIGLEPRIITSLDIRLSGGSTDKLFNKTFTEVNARTEAAKEEIIGPVINLRKDEFSYVKDFKRIKKTIQLSLFLLLFLLLIVGINITFKFISLKEEHALLKKKIHSVYQKAFPEDKKVLDPARQFKGNLNRLKEKRSVLAGVEVLDTLRTIANLKKNGIIIHEYSTGEKNILIKGTSGSFEEVESFRNALSIPFDDIRITDSSASPDKKISFSILMKGKQL